MQKHILIKMRILNAESLNNTFSVRGAELVESEMAE